MQGRRTERATASRDRLEQPIAAGDGPPEALVAFGQDPGEFVAEPAEAAVEDAERDVDSLRVEELRARLDRFDRPSPERTVEVRAEPEIDLGLGW